MLNGQTPKWNEIRAGVPQGPTLGQLFSIIYINDLSYELCCSPKPFADNTSLFSVIKNVNVSAKRPNKDLENISK